MSFICVSAICLKDMGDRYQLGHEGWSRQVSRTVMIMFLYNSSFLVLKLTMLDKL